MIGRKRALVVVEVQTSGPDPRVHRIVEAAGINTTTAARVHLRWPLSAGEYHQADSETLRLIDYDRRFPPRAPSHPDDVHTRAADLVQLLFGNTLGAIDPVTSAAFLVKMFAHFDLRAGWHRRFADLGALAAGAKGIPATAIPHLGPVAAMLDLDAEPHPGTALEAAELAAACFAALEGEKPAASPAVDQRQLHVVGRDGHQ